MDTIADEEGKFEFSGFKLGSYTLFARQDDLVGRELFALNGNQAEFLLTMLPGVYVSGHVFDREGERGKFMQPKASKAIADEMMALSSPVKEFVRDCCEVGPKYECTTMALHGAWSR